MLELPAGAPADLFQAFAHTSAVDRPTVDDMKLMVFLEAAGRKLYAEMAAKVDNAEVRSLLEANGREELAHAHRMSRVVAEITGSDYPVPAEDENPYLVDYSDEGSVDAARLNALAEGEHRGKALYERWASSCDNAKAAALMRLNAAEESDHGDRLARAAALLP